MAAMPKFNVRDEFRKHPPTLTIHVKVVKDWRFKLGMGLVKLGARMMCVNLRIDESEH